MEEREPPDLERVREAMAEHDERSEREEPREGGGHDEREGDTRGDAPDDDGEDDGRDGA